MSTVGFVVAGGRSRRMGRDKALLPWGKGTLLEHAAERLQAVCSSVHVLCGPEVRYLELGLPVHRDLVTDAGPLGGLYTGLSTLQDPDAVGLFLAVDLPLVPVDLLRAVVEACHGRDAVVPVAAGGPQPLCAAYRARCRDAVEGRLTSGDRKATSFWPEIDVRELGEAELRRFGDAKRLFLNVNTPEDLARAL